MPDSNAKTEFVAKLKASLSFRKMTPEEQSELLRVYENADEATLPAATAALYESDAEVARLEAQKAKILEDQVALAKEINQSSKDLTKAVLQETEQKETASSDKEADALLKQIGVDKEPPKKKKLFGIF